MLAGFKHFFFWMEWREKKFNKTKKKLIESKSSRISLLSPLYTHVSFHLKMMNGMNLRATSDLHLKWCCDSSFNYILFSLSMKLKEKQKKVFNISSFFLLSTERILIGQLHNREKYQFEIRFRTIQWSLHFDHLLNVWKYWKLCYDVVMLYLHMHHIG